MPIVQITLIEGRDEADIKRCIKEVARTIHQTLAAPLETVRVIVHQVPASQFGIGDRTRDEIDMETKGETA